MSKKPKLSPILSSDTPDVRQEIQTFLDYGYRVVRHSKYHLKIGSISYYPGKGTIMEDPHHVRLEKGLDELINLIDSLERRMVTLEI